jgi:predicted DsbA family dithiol-disulfide isomerase
MIDPGVEVKWTAFFPLASFPNFGDLIPAKASHNIRDILRMTKAYGMKIGQPILEDPDWAISHLAFEVAAERGRGVEMAMALFAERWSEGEDIATAPIIARAAASVGLDADDIVAASHDAARQQALRERIQADYDDREIFGVPMLITPQGKRFWGSDRIEWAIRYGYVPGKVSGP